MARLVYVPEELGKEVVAPSGYYLPIEEMILDHDGKQVLYVRGSGCIEASCCGVGSWQYLRVQGYVVHGGLSVSERTGKHLEIDTIEDAGERAAITEVLSKEYPGARVEFR